MDLLEKKKTEPIDEEVIMLKTQCLKDPRLGLLLMMDAFPKYQEHRDFFKIKEIFIYHCE
jgi:hypothetical protein